MFIDMFLGSGAVAFAMVNRCKYIIANDNDDEVFNLFMVVKERKDELIQALQLMPVHESLFKHWKTHHEYDNVWKAVRFLLLSNFSYLGKGDMMHFGQSNSKEIILEHLSKTFEYIQYIKFMCADFRNVLGKVSFRKAQWDRPLDAKTQAFIYADPPYLETGNNYQECLTEQGTQDLFEILVNSGIRFALSEFDNPFVLNLAKEYHLHVTVLGERQTLKNRRVEILITNYEPVRSQIELL